ncbi:MAG: competence/damage-inducible protein A [Sandaracinaceae bacterium]
MHAAILSIGTELTRGELTNTNASWLADRLTQLGLEVVEHLTVPDDMERIVQALGRLCVEGAAVVSTGGLGPTTDDLTAAAAARAAGVARARHEPSFEALKARYQSRGREVTESNATQADLPETATALPNAVGTAPGFELTIGAGRAFFLPGVPHEMKRMFDDRVHPALARTVERRSNQVRLRTFGLPESSVGERLAGLEEANPGVRIGYRASFPEIEVKVLATAASEAEAAATANRVADDVRGRLGDAVYGQGDDTYAEIVGHDLRDQGLTVAVAESCTGGLVGQMLTDVPGSSDYLLFDAVTYSNAAKTEILGVGSELLRAHGAVSGECAAAMADGVRRRAGADLAVSITGIAGPGGGSEEKPVGTVWMGLAREGHEATAVLHQLSGERWQIRRRAAFLALRTLREAAHAVVADTRSGAVRY